MTPEEYEELRELIDTDSRWVNCLDGHDWAYKRTTYDMEPWWTVEGLAPFNLYLRPLECETCGTWALMGPLADVDDLEANEGTTT